MANQKNLEKKQVIIDEIVDKVKSATSIIWFDYRGLTVGEMMEIRKALREKGSELKIYKNTLAMRALKDLNITLDEELEGPKAVAFCPDEVGAAGVLKKFAKDYPTLEIKTGIVNGKIVGLDVIEKLASIPSKDVLFTMLANSLIGNVRNLALSLDLYSKKLENK